MDERYRLFGSIGSPYALKLRALLRYRRIPFDWVPASLDWMVDGLPKEPASAAASAEIAHVRPPVIPVLWFPQDQTFQNDSTPIAHELERRHATRSVLPDDPVLAFLSFLLEDMADEWIVKLPFQYRWGVEQNASFKSRIVAAELLGGGFDEQVQLKAGRHFARRQQGRMPLVGCTPENAPLIEEVYRRVLDAMQHLQGTSLFFFGSRPALADFGWYGSLASLATDPTSAKIMAERAPATFQWLQALDDASGVEGQWIDREQIETSPVFRLVELAAQIYLPYLVANESAVEAGEKTFTGEALGHRYTQTAFKYQVKCLREIRREYSSLDDRSKAAVDRLLARAGCQTAIA